MDKISTQKEDTITINKMELYKIVQEAVYDALSNFDFITHEELELRKQALRELAEGEAINWDDHYRIKDTYLCI